MGDEKSKRQKTQKSVRKGREEGEPDTGMFPFIFGFHDTTLTRTLCV